MNSRGDLGDGICILSFDSGGPGTYSQLVILREYMSRLADDMHVSEDDIYPADYFDLMGGVGFGGLIALMLGHLRMTVNEAIDSLLEVVSTVFPEGSQGEPNLETNSTRLKEAIEEMLHVREIPLNAKMNELNRQQRGCKVALYAATTADVGHPHIFRTYASRGSSLNPTIVEAVCATISIPSHFLPVKIGSRFVQQKFVGGPHGVNNPTRELVKEAGVAFGNDKRVAQIISVGGGTSHILSLDTETNEAGAGRLLKEIAADCQTVARELETRLFNIEAYHRFNVTKGPGNVEMDDWGALGDIDTYTRSYIEAEVVTMALDASLRCLRSKIGTVTLSRINQTSSIKVAAKTAPPVSPFYVVRGKPTAVMIHHLVTSRSSRQRILPITGMAGSGKTQLVSYFLQEYSSLFTHVVFVDAISSSSIKTDVETWSRALGDGHEQDVWEDGLRFLSNTPTDTRQALIFDNADDTTLRLAPFIPKNSRVTVIITSRNRDVGSLSTTCHLELGEMEVNEALETLLNAARRDLPLSVEELEKAHALMEELGYLAVALVQAGAYCHQLSSYRHGILYPYTFGQYLVLFTSYRPELMKKAQPSPLDRYERGVYTTLDLSYNAIPQASREFLHFLSFFHHKDIPLEAFAKAAMNHFVDESPLLPRFEDHNGVVKALESLLCTEGNWSELQVQQTICNLRSFSLISATSVQDCLFLQLHPLVQAWSRDTAISTRQYRAMVMQTLTSFHGSDSFRLYRHLLPHIIEILSQIEIQDVHVNDLLTTGGILEDQGHYQKAARLLESALDKVTASIGASTEDSIKVSGRLAKVYWGEGRLGEAEKLTVEVLEQRRKILGMEHPDTITAVANLATTYYSQGRWSEAEKVEVEVLEQTRKIMGMEHPVTISAAANLASIYHSQGRWSEAEKLGVEVLEQMRKILGMGHPVTISAAANLASIYHSQGRWSEAEKLMVEVLEQRRKILGMEHPNTITAAANIALIYHSQGRWSEAEKLEMEVLEQTRKILGMEHPNTITAAANLASTYHSQGRWSEAEKLRMEVLEQRRKILGMEHPDTIAAVANLATTYYSQGRWSEAERLTVEGLEQTRRVLGMEHPDTSRAAANVASTYRSQGRWSEAEKLEVEVLEQRRKIFGMEHPDTVHAVANLATTYHSQGRWSEGEKLEVEVLEQRRKVLGVENPDTIQAVANLATTYHSQGRWSEAEKLRVEVLEQSRRVLAMEHPDTIRAAANLATTYHSQGRWSEAEKLEVEVLEQRRRLLGMEHPDTITAVANLAATYHSQGRWSEGEKLEVEVLGQRRKVLGVENSDTIQAVANLATTYHSQGRWSEAEKLMVEVLEQRRKILGMEHPDTIMAAANLASTYRSQGRWSEAEKLMVEALEQSRRVLGVEHPATIRAAANIASTYHSQGRWSEAEKLMVEVLEQRKRVLGTEHPDTIQATANLASTYHSQGRWSEAEKLMLEVLDQTRRVLGMEHPDTIRAAANLASTHHSQCRWNEAEKLKVEVLDQRRRILGMEHPDTVAAAVNLAITYCKQDRWDKAVQLLEPALTLSVKNLGQRHPQTQHYIRQAAAIYERLGRGADAQGMKELLLP